MSNKKRQHPESGLPPMILPPKSDLLSRVGAFLPKIEAANKDLETVLDDKEVRVDLQLEPDEENDDDEEEEEEDKGNSSDDDEEKGEFLIREHKPDEQKESSSSSKDAPTIPTKHAKQPTIELKLTLGKFNKNNPVMELLGSGSDNDADESPKKEQLGDEEEDSKPSNNLLNVVAAGTKRKRSGPLITELS